MDKNNLIYEGNFLFDLDTGMIKEYKIGNSAFSGCTSLTSISCKG